MKRFAAVALILSFAATAALAAAGYRLAPYKDDLFQYPGLISQKDGGDYVVVDYRQARDLDQRDVVPEKKAQPQYVSLDTDAVQQDLVLQSGDHAIQYIRVGTPMRLIDWRDTLNWMAANDGR